MSASPPPPPPSASAPPPTRLRRPAYARRAKGRPQRRPPGQQRGRRKPCQLDGDVQLLPKKVEAAADQRVFCVAGHRLPLEARLTAYTMELQEAARRRQHGWPRGWLLLASEPGPRERRRAAESRVRKKRKYYKKEINFSTNKPTKLYQHTHSPSLIGSPLQFVHVSNRMCNNCGALND